MRHHAVLGAASRPAGVHSLYYFAMRPALHLSRHYIAVTEPHQPVSWGAAGGTAPRVSPCTPCSRPFLAARGQVWAGWASVFGAGPRAAAVSRVRAFTKTGTAVRRRRGRQYPQGYCSITFLLGGRLSPCPATPAAASPDRSRSALGASWPCPPPLPAHRRPHAAPAPAPAPPRRRPP